jgi:putative ABC transport system permease protein
MDSLRTAIRFLRRDWRAGELRLLATAIVVAVASVTAVGFFTDRVERAMTRQASEVLAADLVLEWSARPADSIETQARDQGLRSARTLGFPSVVLAGETTQLIQVKAVSPGYPLRGAVRTAPEPGVADAVTDRMPGPGEAWVEPRLLALLGLQPGGQLKLGELDLRVSRVLTYEPDRAANLFRLAPRVMIRLDDAERSGLLGPASRVRHRLLLAGEPDQVDQFRRTLDDRLPQGAELSDVRNARPEIRDALDRGGRFLRLTAVTATLLCLVAVALSTRRFVQRQADASALLRCLGASGRRINAIFAWRLLLLGVAASLAGGVLGLATQPVLAALVGNWFTEALPPPSAWPFVTGLVTGVLVLSGFALPSVLRLGKVPPLRVFRRDLEAPPVAYWLTTGAAVAAVAALLFWQVGDDAMAGRLVGGMVATIVVLLGASRLLVQMLRGLRRHTAGSWRYGLASLSRNPATTSVQLTGFGLGITALLLLAMVRVDLLSAWQRELPADAPNHFLINIQPEEVDDVRDLLDAHDIDTGGPYPMARARLLTIDGRPVNPDAYTNPRARRLAEREFNLSWSRDPQPDNRIAEGRWWSAAEAGESAAFSVETGIAETLGIGLDDALEFDIAGERVEARVTSLRTVQWDSFNANFFVVGTPFLMRDKPATYIASFHLPPERHDVIREIVAGYPSVTPLDVSALIAQVRGIMDRGALAVEFVFLFTLLAGVVVLVASIQASRELRLQEAAVLRTLGLKRRRLLEAIALEFGLLGALAGFVAAAAATVVSYSLATGVFGLPWRPDPAMWLIAIAGGAMGVGAAGVAATWRITREPPVAVLREA